MEDEKKKKKPPFHFKVGLRRKDKKRIIQEALAHGLLSHREIESVIKQSKNFIKNRKKCYICGKREGLKICSGCKNFFYCSKEHQEEDWKEHKKVCKFYRYCAEDRLFYVKQTREGKDLTNLCPASKLEEKIIEKVLTWKDYFFSLRGHFYNSLFETIIKVEEEEEQLKKTNCFELPEFRVASGKLSFSLSLYYALQIFGERTRNRIVSLVIPWTGPSNVNLLELVRELCLVLYNTKILGITFVGETVPTQDEISQVTYEGLAHCSVFFFKKPYNVAEMVRDENLVVLHRGILYERLAPLFDLLLKRRNVLILFNTRKYFDITYTLMEILGAANVQIVKAGENPFKSLEVCDPCKKILRKDIMLENRYLICCRLSKKGKSRDMEKLLREYLEQIIQNKKMTIAEIYLYMIGVQWGFAKSPEKENSNENV